MHYAFNPQNSLLQEVVETKYHKDFKNQFFITGKSYPVILIVSRRKMLARS